MLLNLRKRISSLRHGAPEVREEASPLSPQDQVLLASPLNHPLLVEQALGLVDPGGGSVFESGHETRLSWLFDPRFYLDANPDVKEAGEHPYLHFLVQGISEGRSPHPLVDLGFLASGLARPEAPWTVEELAGALRNNQASPHPLFDVAYYLKCNPDVREAGWGAFEHYLAHGAEEGRSPNPHFIADWYLEQDPELPRGRLAAFVHFVRQGVREGRLPGPAAAEAPSGTQVDVEPLPKPTTAVRRVEGRLDEVHGLVASGWAWAPSEPDAHIGVELVAEGRIVGFGAANLLRQDLKEGGLGDGHHAFRITLSKALQDGHLHLVRARVRHHPEQVLAGAKRIQVRLADDDVLDAMPVNVAMAALAAQGFDEEFLGRAASAFMDLESSDPREAIAAIESLAEQQEGCGIVVAKLAEARLFTGDPEAALVLYDRAAELEGVPLEWIWLGRGSALRRLDRKQEAADCYAAGLRIAPGNRRLRIRSRELATRERLLECNKLLADNRPERAAVILGDLLLHAPGDGSVQSLALQARRAASGLKVDGLDATFAEAHRELDLLETVLQQLDQEGGLP